MSTAYFEVCLAHGLEIANQIGQIYVELDDAGQSAACTFEDGSDVLHGLRLFDPSVPSLWETRRPRCIKILTVCSSTVSPTNLNCSSHPIVPEQYTIPCEIVACAGDQDQLHAGRWQFKSAVVQKYGRGGTPWSVVTNCTIWVDFLIPAKRVEGDLSHHHSVLYSDVCPGVCLDAEPRLHASCYTLTSNARINRSTL